MPDCSRGSVEITLISKPLTGCDEVAPEDTLRASSAGNDAIAELLALQLAEIGNLEGAAFEGACASLDEAFPGRPEIWKTRVQRQIRERAYDDAVALIDARAIADSDADLLLAKAELLHDARAYDRAGELFAKLVEQFPERRDIRTLYAKRLYAEGQLAKAFGLLKPLIGTFPEGTKSHALIEKTADLLGLLTRLEGRPLTDGEDARILAMKHAILHFRDRVVGPTEVGNLGRLTLITGSLGPGGAERQLTRLAIELERARKAGVALGDISVSRPVEIVVRSHGPEKQNDFYLADVVEEGVELHQINLFEPLATRDLGIDDPILATLIDYLPPSVNYGVRRMTAHFRRSDTDTASMWQDGACLFGGLAALVAGVPHIQLAIRGLSTLR